MLQLAPAVEDHGNGQDRQGHAADDGDERPGIPGEDGFLQKICIAAHDEHGAHEVIFRVNINARQQGQEQILNDGTGDEGQTLDEQVQQCRTDLPAGEHHAKHTDRKQEEEFQPHKDEAVENALGGVGAGQDAENAGGHQEHEHRRGHMDDEQPLPADGETVDHVALFGITQISEDHESQNGCENGSHGLVKITVSLAADHDGGSPDGKIGTQTQPGRSESGQVLAQDGKLRG